MGFYTKYLLPKGVHFICGTKRFMSQRKKIVALAEGRADPVVVNLHYLGDRIEHHLAGRDIRLSWERGEILDTGGGLKAALPLFGPGPVMTLNPDAVWTGPNPLETIAAQSGELTTALRQLDAASGQDGAALWRWIRLAVLIGYGAVAAGSLVVQGAMAYYYRSLRRVVDGLARLPAWARTVQ